MQKNIKSEIEQVAQESLDKLKNLGVPPFPKHYNDVFLEVIDSHQEIDKDILSQNEELFFREDRFQKITNDTIEMAKLSVKEFKESNNKIREISSEKRIELSKIEEEENVINVQAIRDIFKIMIGSIIDELNKSDQLVQKMQEKLESFEKDANLNPLTKIYNFTIFKNKLEHILRVGKSKDLDVYVAIIDADDFKHINDVHGRIAGDKTIIYLARTLQNSLREDTKVYHTNGTEFMLILNRLSTKNIKDIVSRIIKEISESKLYYKGKNISLTVSAGLTKHKQNDTFESIIKRAKDAVSMAKKSGKNCYKEVY